MLGRGRAPLAPHQTKPRRPGLGADSLNHAVARLSSTLDAPFVPDVHLTHVSTSGRQDFHLTHLPLKKLSNSDWRVGLLLGPSGSGKSTQLRALQAVFGQAHSTLEWGGEGRVGSWPVGTAAAALGKGAAGLLRELGGEVLVEAAGARPFHQLSLGQRTLLALARLCVSPCDQFGEAVHTADEFTSWLDRESASSASAAMGRIWRRRVSGRLVCATVHADVLHKLRPCWLFDLATKELVTDFEWEPQPAYGPMDTAPLKLREGPEVQNRTYKELLELLQRAGEEDEADGTAVFEVPEISVEVRLTNR